MNIPNLITTSVLLITSASEAQIRNFKTETVKVYGNCGMCETTIEKAGNKKKFNQTDWNADTKMASISYDSKKTNLDAVLKSIALSGYDNEKYLAPDEVYNKLHGCCKYEREKKQTVKPIQRAKPDEITSLHNHTGHDQYNMVKDMQQASQLKAVFDNYFALKDALVKTDATTASAKAATMLSLLVAVEMGKLNTEEHAIWMKVEKILKAAALHIEESKEPSQQRGHFISLSDNLYELIKASKPAETIYYQFCPMANDGKGAHWLSKESAIKNPYYGSQMLSCGKTVEIIKQ